MMKEKFMREAIQLAMDGMIQGDGGPFGCVIVRGEEIIARGHNRVTSSNDPTAHAEVVAIREACTVLNTFQLDDCELYTSCEPCPMCLGAIYWSRPRRVYFACHREDAAAIGFDDAFIYEELRMPLKERRIPIDPLLREEGLKVFEAWKTKENKIEY